MGLFDTLKQLSGQQGGGAGVDHPAVAQALMQEADQHPGGLAGLLGQFRQNGMGQHVDSWTSPQQNQSISPEQVQQGMGGDFIGNIAQRAGISPTVAKVALATVLPLVVSHLSQNGASQLPGQGGLAGMAEGLLSRAL